MPPTRPTVSSPGSRAGLLVGGVVGLLFVAALLVTDSGIRIGVVQPDALIYSRYALQAAEGMPYSFNPGDPATTAATSHLWLWLMTIPAFIGGGVSAIAAWGTLLGFGAWLVTIRLAGRIAGVISPGTEDLAALFVAMAGQTAMMAFSQVDIAIYIPAVLAAILAALEKRDRLLTVLLGLLPWIRPEGVLFAVLLGLVCLARCRSGENHRAFLFASVLGIGSFGLLLLFNLILTGSPGFSSMESRRLLADRPLWAVAGTVALGMSETVQNVILGIPSTRLHTVFPVVTFVLAMTGLCFVVRARKDSGSVLLWAGLCVVATIAIGAAGGYHDSGWFRLSSWMTPLLLVFAVAGLCLVAERWELPRSGLFIVVGVMLGYQALGLVAYGSSVRDSVRVVEGRLSFVKGLAERIEEGERIASPGNAGYVAVLPGRAVVNPAGFASPRFHTNGELAAAIEVLKHEPEARFEWWLVEPGDLASEYIAPLAGAVVSDQFPVFSLAATMQLARADMSLVNIPNTPLDSQVQKAVEGLTRIGSLDVGYLKDEREKGYRIVSRYPESRSEAFVVKGRPGETELLESGRLVSGYEKLNLRIDPNKDLVVVLRLATEASVRVFANHSAARTSTPFAFELPMILPVLVNERRVGEIRVEGAVNRPLFEVVHSIPADQLSESEIQLMIGGDHLSTAMWFFQ